MVQEATEARLPAMATVRRVKGGVAPGSSGRKNVPVVFGRREAEGGEELRAREGIERDGCSGGTRERGGG